MFEAPQRSLKAVVLHSEPVLALGLIQTLRHERGISVTPDTADADVIVADYVVGIELATTKRHGGPPIVMVTTAHREHEIRRALDSGIQGYVLLHCAPPELLEAVRVVGRGSRYLCSEAVMRIAESLTRVELTRRETEVLRMLALGCRNKIIARDLNIALATAKMHVKTILGKLDACSRTQAVTIAAERGLVTLQPIASTPSDVGGFRPS